MMERLLARGQAIAEQTRGEAVARVANAAEATLPEVGVTSEADGVMLTGRGLTRRLADEPQLRWIGSLVR